jgi:flagellar protein FliS
MEQIANPVDLHAMSQTPGPPNRYLDARVNTASQPELQLMLLDGALRFGRQAQELWDAEHHQAECDWLLGRMLDVIEELVHSVTRVTSALAKRLEEEYAFAFRQLAAARLNHDAAALDAAMKLLELERETWKLACEKARASDAAPATTPLPSLHTAAFAGQSLSLHG